jgi:PAS domain-containing protein
MADESEDDLLRSVALQNAQAILLARQRAEQELIQAKEALEQKTEELTHAKELIQNVFDQAAVGIARIDATGRLLMVNPRLCEILGYTPRSCSLSVCHN